MKYIIITMLWTTNPQPTTTEVQTEQLVNHPYCKKIYNDGGTYTWKCKRYSTPDHIKSLMGTPNIRLAKARVQSGLLWGQVG